MSHVHNWQEVSPGYYECSCGASKVVSERKPKRD